MPPSAEHRPLHDVAAAAARALPARAGIGLKPQPAETGVGLTSMRSRAARIGGIITLGAGPLGGTRVTVTCARAEAATPA